MPKYRQLHTKIIDSFDFNDMPDDFTRVIWLLLTLILDSEGRGIDNPSWIKSKMFPMRADVLDIDIVNSFDWLEKRKMIVRYEVDEHRYFYIPTFKIYQSGTQKEAASVLPAPELVKSLSGANQEEVRAAASASAFVYESESESVNESGEEIDISPIQKTLEEIIGLPPANANDITAMDEIEKMGASREDIKNGVDEYIKTTGKTVRYYSSVVGWVRTAMSKRIQVKPSKKYITKQDLEASRQ